MEERNPTDEALMLAYQKGDVSAFSTLLSRHKRPLFSYLLRSVRRPALAEELFQELFMRVIQAAPTYRPDAKFRTWLYTLARNMCIDHARREQHRQTEHLESEPGEAPSSENFSFEARIHLERALHALPSEQREVFLMREVSELSFAEIAEILGCPEGTVKSRMRYALLALREDFDLSSSERVRES